MGDDLATGGGVFSCRGWKGTPGRQFAESWEAAQHPTEHRTVSTTKNFPAPDVNRAKVKKLL